MEERSWLNRQAYPFASRHLDLTAGRMHYVDEASGPTVLMFHDVPENVATAVGL